MMTLKKQREWEVQGLVHTDMIPQLLIQLWNKMHLSLVLAQLIEIKI